MIKERYGTVHDAPDLESDGDALDPFSMHTRTTLQEQMLQTVHRPGIVEIAKESSRGLFVPSLNHVFFLIIFLGHEAWVVNSVNSIV